MVAAHAVLGLKMADERLDGGAAFHLAPDLGGDPARDHGLIAGENSADGEGQMMRAPMLAASLAVSAVPACAAGLSVTTPAFKDGGTIPSAQVCERYHGGNHSPALSWSGEPAGTKSFAITMYDPDAPTGSGFWHWTVFNIPPNVHALPEAAGDGGSTSLPAGAGQGRNDGGVSHYSGPCPPVGPAHRYQITVFAVKMPKLPVDAESSGARVGFNLHFNTLAKGQVTGLFAQPK